MSFRQLIVIFSVIICASAKSLTLVIDTTYSMQNEINMIRTRIGGLVNSVGNSAGIENYVVVPFNDPEVGPAQSFTNPASFIKAINSLRVSGGDDIPENSLTGIEKALLESKPESDIFLFTDACAKDEKKFTDIQRLCGVTRSKVIVFMSGSCRNSGNNMNGNIETYHNLAKVCFGNMFQLDSSEHSLDQMNYEQAFTFMKEIIRSDYNDVKTFESFTGYHSLPFRVGRLTQDMIVVVSGRSPSLLLSEQNGQNPRTDELIATQQTMAVRIVEPHRGELQITVSCQGRTSLTVYTKMAFPLQIGFSPLYPRNIEETASKPLPGQESFIFVLVPKSYKYKLNTLTITFLKEHKQKTMSLIESEVAAHIYIAQTFFEPRSAFRMTVNGIDNDSYEVVQLISKAIEPQTEVSNVPWSGAVIQSIIPESSLTYYKNNATVACKVTGCPQPTIWWEDEDGQKIVAKDGFLEYPATYISYVTIPYITENKTISCKASTPDGKDSKNKQLYVYRPYVFRMIRIPEDTTIQYEAEGKLYCEVDAYPEAETSWYHNDKTIVFTTNTVDGDFGDSYKDGAEPDYFREDNALVIKNMSSSYTGIYRCEVKNDANSKSFPVEVRISGLESPKVEISDTDLTSKLGDGVKISCRITKGTPTPTVTWRYKAVDGFDFTDLPEDVEVDEGNLTINEVKSSHKGTYKCEAINEQGQDSKEVNLRVIYAPKILNAETSTMDVLLDKYVTLECSVDAEPKATVKWERDGMSFLDDKHIAEGTVKFVAHANDSGSYRCIAENEAGTAEKRININVNVKPYITPVPNSMTVRTGSTLRLSCNIEEGNPAPSMEWRFKGLDSKFTVLTRSENDLVLPRMTKSQAGTYSCIATNEAGFDRIEIVVNVE